MKTWGIVPCRMESTRFPGKFIKRIKGKEMFRWVYESALYVLDEVYVASDSGKIAKICDDFEIPHIMTKEHRTGTDRVYEACCTLDVDYDDIVINLQADEPLMHTDIIRQLVKSLRHPDYNLTSVATCAREITLGESHDEDVVKVVRNRFGNALYFSRQPIPGIGVHLGQIGIYGFLFSALEWFFFTEQADIEIREKLEQLRFLYGGVGIHVSITKHKTIGVDRPGDIDKVLAILDK